MRARLGLALVLVALAAAFVLGLWLSLPAKSDVPVEIGTALSCELQTDGSIVCVES